MINVNLLPKNLRRRREPGYWRIIAVAVPVLAFSIIFLMQLAANQELARLTQEKELREVRLSSLQPFIREQQELLARQRQLNELIQIAEAVRRGKVIYSDVFFDMLETLPPAGESRPNIAFENVTIQSIDEAASQQRVSALTYDGAGIFAELTLRGNAVSSEILADYILSLQDSTDFGVSFQDAQRSPEDELYSFSLVIGALRKASQ